MTASLLPQAKQQYFNNAGNPLAGGKVYTYAAGTSTPKATYSDAAGTIVNANPIILDARGEATVFWSGNYKVTLKDASDTLIWSQDNVTGGGGDPLAIGPFTIAASMTIATGTDLVRTSRYNTTAGVGGALYNYDAVVNAGYVAANPLSSFMSANGRGFRLCLDQIVAPQMFGADGTGNAAIDDYTPFQAFLTFIAVNRVAMARAWGDYYVATGLIFDGTTGYNAGDDGDQTMVLDLSNCRITATAAIQRLLTYKKIVMAQIVGRPHLRGVGYSTDVYTDKTCETGLFLETVGELRMDGTYTEGFTYAGIETERNPSNNNNLHIGLNQSKRCGSGAPLGARSLAANWSARVDSGAYGDTTQYSEITVDVLPTAYITEMAGAQMLRTVLVEISGKLHVVRVTDRTTSKLQVYPRILTSLGNSGTLKYHHGGAVALRGNDTNNVGWDSVSAIACGSAVALGSLYGGDMGEVHAEACGSWMQISTDPAGQVYGANVGHRYCEGNTFNLVSIGGSTTHFKILSSSAADPASKDCDLYTPLTNPAAGEGYYSEGLSGMTLSAPEGFHYRRKRFNDTANEAIDFNQPRTFEGMTFISTEFTETADFSLVAADTALREQFNYDLAYVTVLGRGTNGEVLGNITFTPPSGHAINGGAADATAVFAGFDGPVTFAIYNLLTAWTIKPVAGQLRGGKAGVTVVGDAAATLTAYTSEITQRWDSPLTVDRAVTLSTTGAREGNRFRIIRTVAATGAFNLNVGTGPLKALGIGTWCEVEYDGAAWVLAAYGAL